jgi:uncharacterized membrane protein
MGRIWRPVRARFRLVMSVILGLIVAPLLPGDLMGTTRGILAWDIGVLAYLVLAAHLFLTEPASRVPFHAEAQQEGEWTIFWLTLGVVIVSFVAVTSEFVAIKSVPADRKGWYVGLVAVTLLASWLVTHVSFAFRYAHEYYSRDDGGPDFDRGLDFPDEKLPDYLDFMYFALVLGMTFQVSDVQITSRKLRRVAMVQGLLSFLFNTVIVALTVNIGAGMM